MSERIICPSAKWTWNHHYALTKGLLVASAIQVGFMIVNYGTIAPMLFLSLTIGTIFGLITYGVWSK
jgi:intracellular septation protein A